MSKKYVPPFMRDSSQSNSSSQPSQQNSFWDSTPQQDNQRFNFSSNRTTNSYQPLVNTSKPAKEAPKLEAGTLASLTKQTSSSTTSSTPYVPLSNKTKPVNVQSDQDFPSLGGSTKVKSLSLNNTYASLARSWAEKKKEDDERAKKEAKELADKKRLEKENEEKEKQLFKIRANTYHALYKMNNKDDDTEYDLGDNKRVALDIDDSYDSFPSDYDYVDDDDEDQQNEDELDDAWNRRRSKNDLY